VLGETKLHPATLSEKPATSMIARAPGMKHRHYAPKAEMILVEGDPVKVVKRIKELAAISIADGKKIGILATDESLSNYDGDVLRSLGSRNNLAEVARNLFRLLREFDEEKVDLIIAEGVPPRGLGLAVMNRLRRAASFKILKAS
jgi:L-threonylcarbamoyladenylate synthase